MPNHTDNALKVIQAGCGTMGKGWIEAALKTEAARLVGLVDVQQPTAAAVAAQFNLPAGIVFPTLSDALQQTEADAVFDVTIPGA